ncbi:MAG TPA: FHA domain-containing protein, partial [Pirellulales bacterium]|nr:FHA domain-containing protein [Pirellulales bacterium]
MAIIEIINGDAAGQQYELAVGQTVLGRDPFCDVILPLRSISRQHARILAERGQYYIEDLHSLNGTFVNGQRVSSRSRLKDHDRIQLYETQMTFYETRPETPPDSSVEDVLPAAAETAPATATATRSAPARSPARNAEPVAAPPAIEKDAVGRTTMVVNVKDAEARLKQEGGAQARLQAVL